ncbi:PH domain-containing protein [Natronospira sp.]|uniref:PH domain-containing protein n=1 Tax=Natronospira sp. TaxID=2024970 RepID=UPI0038735A0D
MNQQSFSNEPVAVGELPDFSRLEVNPVSARYRPYNLLTGCLFMVVVSVVAVVGVGLIFSWFQALWVGIVASLATAAAIGHAWLEPAYRGWAVRERDLVERHGVVWRREVVLPIARIQHVETASGPVERWFGLMRLQCFTAGGATADLVFHGLSADTALRIRSHLMDSIDAEPGNPAHD